MVPEARLERVASGLAPVTPGWFVVNTADAAWVDNEWYGSVCIFESDDFVLRGRPDLTEYVKPHAGFTIRVVPAGQPASQYHAEAVQEEVESRAGGGGGCVHGLACARLLPDASRPNGGRGLR